MTWNRYGGKSDVWTGQEWGQSTIPLHSNSKLESWRKTRQNKRYLLNKTRKPFIVIDTQFLRKWGHAKSRSVTPALASVHGTCQYKPVHTDPGITDVGTYCLVPICGFLYGLVSTSVRTGSYQYIPPCTTLYQGYRIPDGWSITQYILWPKIYTELNLKLV